MAVSVLVDDTRNITLLTMENNPGGPVEYRMASEDTATVGS
jgi:hypothetical protein